MNQREVREALDIAIDRGAIFQGPVPARRCGAGHQCLPARHPGFNKALKNEFNPTRAKELLARRASPMASRSTSGPCPWRVAHQPQWPADGQLIQQDWAKIGVKATIKDPRGGEYLKRANRASTMST